jgi:dipeptidyl aminopeptidase/acylaminoacyl peptidase
MQPTRLIVGLTLIIGCVASSRTVGAQYFGRNKVQYEKMDFRVAPTAHFQVHFYPAESLATADAARMAERWYERHRTLFRREFTGNPLIFYADPPDFQQSNVIEGLIGEGTGGVTEGSRDRVIMPFTSTYAETDHVLGHELVHVFQYRAAPAGTIGRSNMARLPLWVIEGMAEYLSVGRKDPNTAMWLRDAMRRDDLPTIRDLSGGKFFPYRYGQAVWAYIGGTWGDDVVVRLYTHALQTNWETALATVLRISADSLSRQWHAAIRAQYADAVTRTPPDRVGRPLIAVEDDGAQNVAPAVSPDGRRVAFYSSRDLFSIELYLADARSGKVIRKLTSAARNPHFDALSFINSVGTWSADGQSLAIVVYDDGNNEIAILDAESGDEKRRFEIPAVGAISDLAWSPDGKSIAFSGMAGGISDLYLLDVASGSATQLTNDREAQIHPAWSPDGATLAFATDAGDATDFRELRFGPMRLALISLAGRRVELLPHAGEGKDINPQFSPDGRTLYFISDRDGISDIYAMPATGGSARRHTRVATGVSGITALSPALTVARQSGDLVFTVFDKQGYAIRTLSPSELPDERATAGTENGVLPPAHAVTASRIEQMLADARTSLPSPVGLRTRAYRSGLALDYIGGPAIGVGVGGNYGTAVGGGVALSFSDMLGNHLLQAVVNAPGSIRDASVGAFYINRSRRLVWGIEAMHFPVASVFATAEETNVPVSGGTVPGLLYVQEVQRTYFDRASALFQYPLSTTRRFEFDVSAQRVGFGTEIDSAIIVGDQILAENSVHTGGPPALGLGSVTAAYVTDYSFFAFTSPVQGGRSRFEVSPTFGSLTYQSVLADYRRYFFMRPLTFAVRGLQVSRLGRDAEDPRLFPLFVGQPYLIRGYDINTFEPEECTGSPDSATGCPQFDRLVGSRMAVANVELRIPLFGTEAFGLFNVPFLPLEIAPFADAAVAWTRNENPSLRFDRTTSDRVPVFSAGVSSRVNLFGAAVLELYWAHPFQRPQRGGHFGFQLMPGW